MKHSAIALSSGSEQSLSIYDRTECDLVNGMQRQMTKPQGVRAVSRSGTGTTPRSQRASSRVGGATPRGEDSERPLSRAIVVDGEDLSSYDTVGDQESRNIDDQESLSKLEWELASESGRLTADGQISRMSILPDTDDEGSTGSSRSFSRMSQQDQGYDINSRLREDELMDDDDEDRESEEEDEVKALH